MKGPFLVLEETGLTIKFLWLIHTSGPMDSIAVIFLVNAINWSDMSFISFLFFNIIRKQYLFYPYKILIFVNLTHVNMEEFVLLRVRKYFHVNVRSTAKEKIVNTANQVAYKSYYSKEKC